MPFAAGQHSDHHPASSGGKNHVLATLLALGTNDAALLEYAGTMAETVISHSETSMATSTLDNQPCAGLAISASKLVPSRIVTSAWFQPV